MEVDHIFIFSDQMGDEARQLAESGFTEGTGRIHPGQGTTNRKFYFQNFFLEILWVSNKDEIRSTKTKPVGLWKRAEPSNNRFSPYGLCISNEATSDRLFIDSLAYQPDYFPDKSIDVITNELFPSLPWTFRLPYRNQGNQMKAFVQHENGIQKLTQASFGVGENDLTSPFITHFKDEDTINFFESKKSTLVLEFDGGERNEEIVFPELNLTINF